MIASRALLPLSLTLIALSFPAEAKSSNSAPASVLDLPTPFNLQSVVLNRAVTLKWEWQRPEHLPAFQHFGFEVLRDDKALATVSGTTFSDMSAAWGKHTYKVRVRGGAKERGRKVDHVSDWSEPTTVTVVVTCEQAPVISLTVTPTKRSYASIPALRMRLTGQASVPAGCHVSKGAYHIDSGTGITKTGPLRLDDQGRFDEYIDALGPEDELPAGRTEFVITTSAESEAGPATSSAYTVGLELQNPYAPHGNY